VTDATLDFRFGWRWLLPESTGACRLYSFAEEEQAFWKDALPAPKCKGDGPSAEMLLINGNDCAERGRPSDAEIDAARVVCVIADRVPARFWRKRLKASFPLLREYGLLPRAGSRVVAPLASSRLAATALGLHRPGRWTARLGVGLARALARAGNFTLLRGRVLLIASREQSNIPRSVDREGLLAHCSAQGMDFALYLGTEDDNRKTVVLPLGSCTPDVILKVAATQRARASLENEAEALLALGQTSLGAQIPNLLGMVDSADSLTLHQEYRPRKSCSRRRMNEAMVAFLGSLSRLNAKKKPLTGVLATARVGVCKNTTEEVAEACRILHARLRRLAEAGEEVSLHRSHGDFAPWNCAWTDKGLLVFDWEQSREQDLALGDAFYYVVAPLLLVRRDADAERTLEATLRFARRVAASGNAAGQDARVYLALWLLSRLGQGRLYDKMLVSLARSWA
jgi:hypothetical protein